MSDSMTWKIDRERDRTRISFFGSMDEEANFSGIGDLAGDVEFDLAGVTRVNSGGVCIWVKFLEALRVKSLKLVRCSVPVVYQLNLIQGFKGKAVIESFYAPYVNEATGHEEPQLLTIGDFDPRCPPKIKNDLGIYELDDVPSRIFSFLKDM